MAGRTISRTCDTGPTDTARAAGERRRRTREGYYCKVPRKAPPELHHPGCDEARRPSVERDNIAISSEAQDEDV